MNMVISMAFVYINFGFSWMWSFCSNRFLECFKNFLGVLFYWFLLRKYGYGEKMEHSGIILAFHCFFLCFFYCLLGQRGGGHMLHNDKGRGSCGKGRFWTSILFIWNFNFAVGNCNVYTRWTGGKFKILISLLPMPDFHAKISAAFISFFVFLVPLFCRL